MNPHTYNLMAVRSDGLSFIICIVEAIAVEGFVEMFDKLSGTNLASLEPEKLLGTMPVDCHERMVIRKFAQFVWDTVFLKMPPVKGTNP